MAPLRILYDKKKCCYLLLNWFALSNFVVCEFLMQWLKWLIFFLLFDSMHFKSIQSAYFRPLCLQRVYIYHCILFFLSLAHKVGVWVSCYFWVVEWKYGQHHEKTSFFLYRCESKDAYQLLSNCTADQPLHFFFLNLKFQASAFF